MLHFIFELNQIFDEEIAKKFENYFDVVLLSQVLEHLPNPKFAVEKIRKVLKQDGICVIAVPHFGSFVSKIQRRNDMFITPPEHINFFQREDLRTCLKPEVFLHYTSIQLAVSIHLGLVKKFLIRYFRPSH